MANGSIRQRMVEPSAFGLGSEIPPKSKNSEGDGRLLIALQCEKLFEEKMEMNFAGAEAAGELTGKKTHTRLRVEDR